MLRHLLYLTYNGYFGVNWDNMYSLCNIYYITFLFPPPRTASIHSNVIAFACDNRFIIESSCNYAIVVCTYVYLKCKRDCLYSLIILCHFVIIAIARRHQRVCCGRTSIFTMRMRFRTSSAERRYCDFNNVRSLFHDKYKLATIVGKQVQNDYVKLFRFCLLFCVTAWVYLKSILFSFSFVVVIKFWLFLQQASLSQYSNWASIVFCDCAQLNC